MREFEHQIHKYKQQLPHMWEKVISAGVSLIVAAAMTVSSTFAWLVLSGNPEVKGINTTITTNGSLEIALANGTTITSPAESLVGDGSKDLLEKNITWGNLINLGDPAYGLENLVLRPAALNPNALLEKPLYGAKYGADGRVETLVSDFAYAYWNQDQFSADQVKYGVRAVSSVTYGPAPGQNLALAAAVEAAENAVNTAGSDLRTLAKNPALQDLVSLMGAYVQAQVDEKLKGEEPIVHVSVTQVESIYNLMGLLQDNMEISADALAAVFNMEMLRRTDPVYMGENKFTGEYLLTATQTEIQNKLKAKNPANETIVQPSMISYLWQLRKDYTQLSSDIAVIETYVGRDDVVYRNLRGSTNPAIEDYVNHIVVVGSTTINGVPIGQLSMSNIGKLTGGGTKPIGITAGILQRMDKFTGAQIQTDPLTVTVMGSKATGQATTTAVAPFVLPAELENALSGDTSYKGSNPIAGDTFGMALDFFVRTNAIGSYLTLQGSPEYEEREEIVSVIIDNETYSLYTVKVDGVQTTAYKKDDTYYAYDREYGMPGDELGTEADFPDAELLKEKVKYIVGYNGVNRVWDEDENALLDTDSTTQGAGSCYTFYASNPEDQQKSEQLLRHFRIVFIDQEGTLLGKASLNVDQKVEQYGKVVVPMTLDVTNNFITDTAGNKTYVITPLATNEEKFITALIYLDGEGLTNDQVLAAGEIQGQLNIQFGGTADMNAMDDPVLMESKCHVTATMAGDTSVAFDTATAAQLKKTVTVTVDGYEPTRVEAYFLREINSTQGIRQQKMTFEQNGEGDWVGTHDFTAPGKYILREVFLDGVAYDLDQEPITFTVEGFTISNVSCTDNGKTYMSTEKSFDTSVSMTFASSDANKMPQAVKGAFIHRETGNRTTVYFTRTVGSTWVGSATLTTSGEYYMEYVELDDQYTGLDPSQYVTINLYLGLTASVYAGDTNLALENGEARDVDVSLVIQSDSGDIIGNLGNVWLQYTNNGSGVAERGLGAQMVWNAARQLYQGTFHLEDPGIYNYHYVSINQQGAVSTLNKAVTAPTITAISSNPPRYISKEGFGEKFALGSSAAFSVRMKNADSATLDAVLTNENDETYYVRGVMDDQGAEQVFTFTLPIVNGTQSGTWTLQNLYMTNVYGGEDNILYDGSIENGPDTGTETDKTEFNYTVAENYYFKWLEWTLDDITAEGETTEPIVRIVSTLDISIDATNTTKEYSGAFGASQKFGNFNMVTNVVGGTSTLLSDYGVEVSAINVIYAYDRTCVGSAANGIITNAYGGNYTVSQTQWTSLLNNTVQNPTVLFTKSASNGNTHTLSTSNGTTWIAGEYKIQSVELTLSQNGVTAAYTVPASVYTNAHTYTIRSAAPTVKITTGTQSGSVSTRSGSRTASFNDTSATVFFTSSRTLWVYNYSAPKVVINLSGIGTASSAKLMFPDTARIYTSASSSSTEANTAKSAYTWTADGNCTKYIGHVQSKSMQTDAKTAAGTITASTLELTKNDCAFTFTLPTGITINNSGD